MAWKTQGSPNWLDKRIAMVTVDGIKLIAVYQPVSPNDGEIEEYRKNLEKALACRRKNEMLLIGRDHNAYIGRQNNIGKTVGAFGLEHGTSAGEDKVAWAQQNDLYIVDTYFQKTNRGTWCHPQSSNWYKLDYFFAKRDQRLVVENIN